MSASRRRRWRTVGSVTAGLVVALATVGGLFDAQPAAAASYSTPDPVPAAFTPAVNDGQVNAITQVGSTMVVGGTFTSVTPKGGSAVARSRLMAFDATTGRLSSFAPAIAGTVNDVKPGPLPGTVYVAGAFTKVGTVSMSRVALLDLSTGAVVSGWKSPGASSQVRSLALTGGRLLIGGDFAVVGGQPRAGLASLDPRTGAVTAFLKVALSVNHNDYGSGAQGPVGARGLEATPDGSKLVVIGNFKKADGLSRDQLAILDLSGTGAAVNGWRTDRYAPYCFNWAFDTYVRGVSVSPDGSFFVVTATGGPNPGTLCDAAARFEIGSTGDDNQPTWVDHTGGDTLWSVDVTASSVYVGGHQRWLNNSHGSDDAGPGSVARPGLAALDPDTGLPQRWNPGRNPRGAAAFVVYATDAGLWVGSDTEYIGNRTYKRPRLAFFPGATGTTIAPDVGRTLPSTLYVGAPRTPSADGSTLDAAAITGDGVGVRAAADPHGMDWSTVRGAFMLGDQLYTAQNDGTLQRRTFTTASAGAPLAQNPYKDPVWDTAPTGSGWNYEGFRPSLFDTFGSTLTGLTWSRERVYWTVAGDPALHWSWFSSDSGIVGSEAYTAGGDVDWSSTAGLVATGDTLYAADATNGALEKVALGATGTTGPLTVVDDTRDWRGGALFLGPRTVANQAPTASFTSDCTERTCHLDATASADADGTVAGYAWDLGDGSTATGAQVSHDYAADGDLSVTLTVTDDAGASASTTRTVSVRSTAPAAAVSYVGSETANAASTKPSVSVPAGVRGGDLLTLVGAFAVDGAAPATPAGWDLLSSTTHTGVTSYVWTRWAQDGDAGTKVVTALAATTKTALSLTAYRGASRTAPYPAYASAKDSASAAHVSPAAAAVAGDWVLQVWTDKSSATTAWTPPTGVTPRGTTVGTGTGRASLLVADSGGPVAAGQVAGATATTDAASSRGIAWTIVIRPGS